MDIESNTLYIVSFIIGVCLSIYIYRSNIKKGEDRFHTFMVSIVLAFPVFICFHSIIPVYVAIETENGHKIRHQYYHIGNNFSSESFGRFIYNDTGEDLYLYPATYGEHCQNYYSIIPLTPGQVFAWDGDYYTIGGILIEPKVTSHVSGLQYYLLDQDLMKEVRKKTRY